MGARFNRDEAKHVDAGQILAMTGLTVATFEDLVRRHNIRPRYVRNHRCFDLDAVWRAIDADHAEAEVGVVV